MIISAYFAALSALFGPVLLLPAALAELVLAVIITFIITIFYRYMIDQAAMARLRAEIKDMQENIRRLQKSDPEAANRQMAEMLKLTNKQLRMSLKPMLPTMIFVLALLPWMGAVFTGPVVLLPFSLPFFGADFGWLMWYILLSIPLSGLFRKILGVV